MLSQKHHFKEFVLRSLTAVLLLLLLFWGIRHFSLSTVAIVVGIFMAISFWEWRCFFTCLPKRIVVDLMIVAALVMYAFLAWYVREDRARDVALIFSGFWALLPLGLLNYSRDRWHMTTTVALLGIACILVGWVSVLWIFRFFGPNFLLWSVLTIMAMDSCAYFVGKLWGRTLLAPSISPRKSLEGLCGAYCAAAIMLVFSVCFKVRSFSDMTLSSYFFIAAIFVLYAVSGDLLESAVKRVVGCKDSGSLLPGHGGVLDRFDSYFSVMPLMFCVLTRSP